MATKEVNLGSVRGPQGAAATVTVGKVTTGSAGSSASVTNSGTSGAAILNFTIPRGATGAQGTPTTVNGKSGTSITLTAQDVGARPSSWTPTPAQIGALPQTSLASYSFAAKQVAAGSMTTFEASYSAAGLPSGATVLSVNVVSTGWGGILPQAWTFSEEDQKLMVSLYNAGTVARSVGPVIGILYY